MKPVARWALAVLAVVVIGILLVLWSRGDREQAPAEGGVAKQPPEPPPVASKPEVPVVTSAPKVDEPMTALVLFDFDRSALRPGEAVKLDELVDKIKGKTFDRLEVVGHADRIGTDSYNVRLSERRAAAVRAYLLGKGIDTGRIRAEPKGETEGVTGEACKNLGTESARNLKLVECLQPDRRVQIAVSGTR